MFTATETHIEVYICKSRTTFCFVLRRELAGGVVRQRKRRLRLSAGIVAGWGRLLGMPFVP